MAFRLSATTPAMARALGLTAPLFALGLSAPAFSAEDYSQWAHSRDLILNTSATGASVATNQIGFPLLVSLGAQQADIFAQAAASGADVRFASSSGNPLAYQIESWDAANQQASVWVRVDTVKGASADQKLRMYWGKPDAADSSNGKNVFRSAEGYQGVWHLGGLEDATGNGNNGIDSGSGATAEGRIGGARQFDNADPYAASGHYIALGNPKSLNIAGRITLEAWVKWRKRDGHRIVVCHGAAANSAFETVLRIGETKDYRAGVWTGTAHYAMLTAPAPDSNAWVHLAGVFTGSGWTLYRNGAVAATLPADSNGAKASPGNWRIGAEYAALPGTSNNTVTRFFDGWLDEVRVSSLDRSADWIKLGYENQRADQTLFKWGASTGLAGRNRRVPKAAPSRTLSRSAWLFSDGNKAESGKAYTAEGSEVPRTVKETQAPSR